MNEVSPKYFLCSLTAKAARKMFAYYNRELAPFGITAHQVIALGVLWQEENISLGVFAERADIGKAAAVAMIDRLEAMGMVTREKHPRDARLNLLKLTEKARGLAPAIVDKVAGLEKAVETAVGKEALEVMLRGLKAINDLDM